MSLPVGVAHGQLGQLAAIQVASEGLGGQRRGRGERVYGPEGHRRSAQGGWHRDRKDAQRGSHPETAAAHEVGEEGKQWHVGAYEGGEKDLAYVALRIRRPVQSAIQPEVVLVHVSYLPSFACSTQKAGSHRRPQLFALLVLGLPGCLPRYGRPKRRAGVLRRIPSRRSPQNYPSTHSGE